MGFNAKKQKAVYLDPSGVVRHISASKDIEDSVELYSQELGRKQLVNLPESVVKRSNINSNLKLTIFSVDEDGVNTSALIDPRSEFLLDMQRGDRGLSGSSGATNGITGSGNYFVSENVTQNMNYITNHGANKVTHYTVSKYNGKSSAYFSGKGFGTTGPYLSIPLTAITSDDGGEGLDGNVRIQFWMKYDTLPSSDETIIARSNGTGSANLTDSFKFHFDQSGTSLKFDCSDYTDTSVGYQHSALIASGTGSSGGITEGAWHHVAMVYHHTDDDSVPYTGSPTCKVYWNGRLIDTETGISGPLCSTGGSAISVGGEYGGFNAYSGCLDALHIFSSSSAVTGAAWFGGVTGATYDHEGASGGGATSDEMKVEPSTVVLMNMDGASGSKDFSMKSNHHAYAICSAWFSDTNKLFIREHGLSGDSDGFNFYRDGSTSGSGSTQQGYVVGDESSAHHLIAATAGTLTMELRKDIKKAIIDNALHRIRGATLEGSTADPGSSNDFLYLFGITSGSTAYSGSSFGVTGGSGGMTSSPGYSDWFSFVPSTNNINELNNYVNYINSGTTGSSGGSSAGDRFIIPDANDWPHTFSPTDVLNLYDDVMSIRRSQTNDYLETKRNVDNFTSWTEITNSVLDTDNSKFSLGM